MKTQIYPALVQGTWAQQVTATLAEAGMEWGWVCEQATNRTARQLGITEAQVTAAMVTYHAPFSGVASA